MDTLLWGKVAVLAAARTLPLFAIVPFFGGRFVPAAVRLGLAGAMLALLVPPLAAAHPEVAALGPVALAGLAAKEAAVGLALGFVVALPFWAAEAAGHLVDGPEPGPLADFALLLAVVVFLAISGHLAFLRALAASYEAVPVTGAIALLPAAERALRASGGLLLAALGLAAPALATQLLAELALAVLARGGRGALLVGAASARLLASIAAVLLALGGIVLALRGELAAAVARAASLLP